MRLLLLIIVTIITLNADEVQRIESILKDITKLRASYEACQEKLDANAFLLKDEKNKNDILMKECNSPKSYSSSQKRYEAVILKLNQKIISQEELLKSKEDENKKLSQKYKKLLATNQNSKKSDTARKIIMKKDIEIKIEEKISDVEIDSDNKIEFFKASAFRLNKDSTIYSDLKGTFFDKWEEGTSFTSGERTKHMIKITGYFVNKQWEKAQNDMWIKAENTVKR